MADSHWDNSAASVSRGPHCEPAHWDWAPSRRSGPTGSRAAASAAGHGPNRRKSVILIFNCGAPSHIDLWDMKPDAPDTVRGAFQADRHQRARHPDLRAAAAPGAAQADKLAIVRTRASQPRRSTTPACTGRSSAGRIAIDNTLINPSRTDYAELRHAGRLAGAARRLQPARCRRTSSRPRRTATARSTSRPASTAAAWAPKYDPFVLNGDPNAADFQRAEPRRWPPA